MVILDTRLLFLHLLGGFINLREFKIIVLLFLLLFSFGLEVNASENEVDRLGGKDRFEVAVNVSQKGWAQAQTVYLVNLPCFC